MTTGTFTELIAARDLAIVDLTYFDTPAAVDCPNTDPATKPLSTTGSSTYPDASGVFLPPWGTSDWTVELWLYRESSDDGSAAEFVAHEGSGGPPELRWRVVYNGTDVILELRSAPLTIVTQYNMTRPTGDSWNHYVWTINSSLGTGSAAGRRIKAYRNGSSFGADVSFTSSFTHTVPSGLTLYVPGSMSSHHWEIAKLALYHRELSATEVSDHYLAMTT